MSNTKTNRVKYIHMYMYIANFHGVYYFILKLISFKLINLKYPYLIIYHKNNHMTPIYWQFAMSHMCLTRVSYKMICA